MTAKPPADLVPVDIDAELAVLGSCLLDSANVAPLRAFLQPRDFYRETNGAVFEAILALDERAEPIDFLTVRAELERRDRLDYVGGPPFLASLINAVPTSIHAAHYARIVAATSLRRVLIATGGDVAALGYDQSITDPLDFIEAVDKLLARVKQRATNTGPTVAWTSSTWEDYGRVVGSIEWLWERWIPRRMPSFIVGSGDAGKSQLALNLVKTTLYGGTWPDGTPTPAIGEVIWLDTEGSGAITLERMRTWGIDPRDVIVPRVGDDVLNDVLVDDPVGLGAIERELQAHPHTALVVIDSLRGAHRAKEKDDDAMSAILKSLASLATRHDVAVAIIHHVTKKDPREPDVLTPERVRGSSVIVNMGRSVIGVDIPDPETPSPDNPRRRVFVLKGNIGKKPAPVGMDIGDAGLRFTADAPMPPRPDTALNRAVDFLAARLDRGPVPTTDLEREAAAQGLSAASINRARKTLGAVAVKDIHGRWLTSLPYKGASD